MIRSITFPLVLAFLTVTATAIPNDRQPEVSNRSEPTQISGLGGISVSPDLETRQDVLEKQQIEIKTRLEVTNELIGSVVTTHQWFLALVVTTILAALGWVRWRYKEQLQKERASIEKLLQANINDRLSALQTEQFEFVDKKFQRESESILKRVNEVSKAKLDGIKNNIKELDSKLTKIGYDTKITMWKSNFNNAEIWRILDVPNNVIFSYASVLETARECGSGMVSLSLFRLARMLAEYEESDWHGNLPDVDHVNELSQEVRTSIEEYKELKDDGEAVLAQIARIRSENK